MNYIPSDELDRLLSNPEFIPGKNYDHYFVRFFEEVELSSRELALVQDVWSRVDYPCFALETRNIIAYVERPLHNRFFKWMEFLLDINNADFIDGVVKGVLYCFQNQILIGSQTEYQFEQSKRFLMELDSIKVDCPGLLQPPSFIICILMCSKRPDIMEGSMRQVLHNYISHRMEWEWDWFQYFFGSNNPFHFLGRHLENLSSVEVELLLLAISGESLRKNCRDYFPVSQKEQALLCSGHLTLIKPQSPILDRYIVAARLLQFESDAVILVEKCIAQSSIFKNKLKTFIKDIEFWQAVVTLIQKELRKNPQNFPELRINNVIDYLEFHRYVFVDDVPYSVKGRTFASLERDMDEWHEMQEYPATREELKERWPSLDLGVFKLEKENVYYRIEELNTGIALLKEGRRMKHCVFSYLDSCVNFGTHIFSLRKKRKQGYKHLVTIEVQDGFIVQASSRYNGALDDFQVEVMEEWKRNLELLVKEKREDNGFLFREEEIVMGGE